MFKSLSKEVQSERSKRSLRVIHSLLNTIQHCIEEMSTSICKYNWLIVPTLASILIYGVLDVWKSNGHAWPHPLYLFLVACFVGKVASFYNDNADDKHFDRYYYHQCKSKINRNMKQMQIQHRFQSCEEGQSDIHIHDGGEEKTEKRRRKNNASARIKGEQGETVMRHVHKVHTSYGRCLWSAA